MTLTISLDLDGTIVKSTFADAVWLEGLPRLYAQATGKDYETAKQELLEAYDQIGQERLEWYDPAYWFKRYQLPGDWRQLLHQHKASIDVFSDAATILPRLAQQFPLVISSNAKREFVDIELKELNIHNYFTHIFSSTSDFHTVKKVTEFYLMICEKLHLPPEDIIHVGDSKRFDYDAPRAAGITAYYLDRTGKEHGPYIVHTLLEFEQRIQEK